MSKRKEEIVKLAAALRAASANECPKGAWAPFDFLWGDREALEKAFPPSEKAPDGLSKAEWAAAWAAYS